MTHQILAAIAVLALTAGVAQAHHSYTAFADQPVTMQGTIERIDFVSPHSLLKFKTADGGEYEAIWRAAYQLRRMGMNAHDLKAGDLISITAYPARDPKVHQVSKVTAIRRPADGWVWRIDDAGRATVGVPVAGV